MLAILISFSPALPGYSQLSLSARLTSALVERDIGQYIVPVVEMLGDQAIKGRFLMPIYIILPVQFA